MKTTTRRLAVPAALVVAGCTPPPQPQPDQCMPSKTRVCLPDGGFTCPENNGCTNTFEQDGGPIREADGGISCFC